jgi:hypothetical protein
MTGELQWTVFQPRLSLGLAQELNLNLNLKPYLSLKPETRHPILTPEP